MRKIIAILTLLVVLCLVGITAGCIDPGGNAKTISVTAYNNTDYKVKIKAESSSGIHPAVIRYVSANGTDRFHLQYGTWTITVWYDSTGSKIDSAKIAIEPTDTYVNLKIYNSTISLYSY